MCRYVDGPPTFADTCGRSVDGECERIVGGPTVGNGADLAKHGANARAELVANAGSLCVASCSAFYLTHRRRSPSSASCVAVGSIATACASAGAQVPALGELRTGSAGVPRECGPPERDRHVSAQSASELPAERAPPSRCRGAELTSASPMCSAGGWVAGIEVVARVVRYLRVVVVVVGIKVVKERADIRYATNFRVSIDSTTLVVRLSSINKQTKCMQVFARQGTE